MPTNQIRETLIATLYYLENRATHTYEDYLVCNVHTALIGATQITFPECDCGLDASIAGIKAALASLDATSQYDAIFAAIVHEREYQTRKWGRIAEHPHEVAGYIALMQSELAEAHQAWCKGRFGVDDLREVLQVIAVGVACLEQHGVRERAEIEEARDSLSLEAENR